MTGIDLDLVAAALVDQAGFGARVAGQLNLETEFGAWSAMVGRAGTPGRGNELDLAISQSDHAVLINHRLAVHTRMEAKDLWRLVLASTTRDNNSVLWLQECSQLERENVLFVCTRRSVHGISPSLSRGIEADLSSAVGPAGKDNVLGGDTEVAISIAVLGAQVDVEVELLALPELAIVILLGGGEDFEALCAAEFKTSMILLRRTEHVDRMRKME